MSVEAEIANAHDELFVMGDRAWAWILLGNAIVGIPSTIFSLCIFRHPSLTAPCYTFLRFIVVMELFNMVCYIGGFFQWLYGERMYETHIGSSYMIYIDTKFEHAFALSVCIMNAFVAFQRGVVVGQSGDYHSSTFVSIVNTTRFARAASLFAIAASTIVYIPSLTMYSYEYNRTMRRNVRFANEHSGSFDTDLYLDVLDYMSIVEFCLILVGTTLTLWGLYRMKKQRYLLRSIRAPQGRGRVNVASNELMLCRLQIAETLPFLIASAIIVLLLTPLSKSTVFDETKILQMPLEPYELIERNQQGAVAHHEIRGEDEAEVRL